MIKEIRTDHPDPEFCKELTALFLKYGIKGANGWDDGSLIIYLTNNQECYVTFPDGEPE